MAKGPAHEFTTGQLDELLRTSSVDGWHVRNQAPITLARSEPEPDLAIARGDRTTYRTRHPSASDVALVVEISDTTLATDRLKGKTYGAATIPEYWIVNLTERCLEIYTGPDPDDERGYAECKLVPQTGAVSLVVDGSEWVSFALSDVLT
jgi:Uma2 family endonuclease